MKRLIESYNIPTLVKAIGLMDRRKKLYVGLILGFCAVEIVIRIIYTAGLRGAINSLDSKNWIVLARYVGIMLLSHALWWLYAPVSAYGCAFASKGTVQRLRTDLCERIIRLPMMVIDKRDKGEMLSILTTDLNGFSQIYDKLFCETLRTLLGGVAGLILMAAIDWRFAIVVLAFGSLSVLLSAGFNGKLENQGAILRETLAKSGGDVYTLVKGAKTLRLNRLHARSIARNMDVTRSERMAKLVYGKLASRLISAGTAVGAATYAVILAAGALFVYFKLSDWGTIVALIALKISTDMLFVEFGQFMAEMQASIARVKKVFELMETPLENDVPAGIDIVPSGIPLHFEDVCFRYTDAPVLNEFSMQLHHPGLTVLIGESGVGKSTVIKLMLGLYTPQSGAVVFDGTGSCTLAAVRGKTAYVPQEPMLLRDTVLNNILCGNLSASHEDAIHAAYMAGADSFIQKLPGGYDTVLTDDGKNLSGGQKQRIAIARALIKNAPILLLDEITAALDGEAEQQIMKTVKELAKTRAILCVTHKADVVKFADVVLRMPTCDPR